MQGNLSDALDETLGSQNPVDFLRELKSIYRQIVPNSHGELTWGRYTGCEKIFREKPSLTNSFVKLLLDAGLTKEPTRVMRYFGKENEDLHFKGPLSSEERQKYVAYINSAAFGEIFFQNRYGIVPTKEGTI
ncbi:MAG: hypothetical protein WCI72_02535 [archaeon]